MENRIPNGSRPVSPDRRDFQHNRYFGVAPGVLAQLPKMGLGRPVFNRTNQLGSYFCTACSTSTASAYIEGVEMSFEWQAAAIGRLVGEPILRGADPRKAMEAMILYGSLPRALAPMTLQADGEEHVADHRNWPETLTREAAAFEKASYFRADTGIFDKFDNIRAALWKADQEAQAEAKRTGEPKKEYIVVAFSAWQPEWDTTIVDQVPPKSSYMAGLFRRLFGGLFGATEVWHAYTFPDWTEILGREVLKAQNSYGWIGDNGIQYFTREVVNAAFSNPYAACYIFRDIDPKNVKSWQEQQSTLSTVFSELYYKLRYRLGI